MKEIAKAIIAVMKDVKSMEKNSKVGTGNNSYNGTKDQDVKEVFNEALSKHGLCMMPISIDETTQIDRWEEVNSYGTKMKQSVFTKVNTKYLLLHISGESVEIAGYGHGIDPQDKAAGKATTYAMKNALLYTFLTPVGKIDDADTTHSDDIPTPKPQKKQAPTNSTPVKPALNKFNAAGEILPVYTKVINNAKEKSVTREQLREYYTISKEVFDHLQIDLA